MAHKISSLQPLILAARPCAAGNAEYFSVSLRVRYEPKVLSDPTPELCRKLEHDVLDAQYLILGVLEGGFATKDRKLQRFFKILCPDGILVEA